MKHFTVQFIFVFCLLSIATEAQYFNWANGIRSAELVANDLSVGPYGNSAVCGTFQDSVNFQNGLSQALFANQNANGFVAVYDKEGDLKWQHHLPINCASVAFDHEGSVFYVGEFYVSADFDPGATVFTLSSGATTSGYICKLDSLGVF